MRKVSSHLGNKVKQTGNKKENSLRVFEEVRLSCWRVEESGVDLIFGQTGSQLLQALWRVLVHGRLTENPVSATWKLKRTKIENRPFQSDQSVEHMQQLQRCSHHKSGSSLIPYGTYPWRRQIFHHLSRKRHWCLMAGLSRSGLWASGSQAAPCCCADAKTTCPEEIHGNRSTH